MIYIDQLLSVGRELNSSSMLVNEVDKVDRMTEGRTV